MFYFPLTVIEPIAITLCISKVYKSLHCKLGASHNQRNSDGIENTENKNFNLCTMWNIQFLID